MSDESTHHRTRTEHEGAPGDSMRAVVFERLIDQLGAGSGHTTAEARVARRLCGRWLLMRRALRKLSYGEVAARTGLSEGAVALLEQGLVDAGQWPEEVWLRLGLVLERHQDNDLARVRAAIASASGRDTACDASFLAGLEDEIAVVEAAAAPRRQPAPVLADELIDLLAAVRQGQEPATAYRIKKRVVAEGGKSWSPADLPAALAALVDDGLLSRSDARPASYALTPAGAEMLLLAEERRRARLAARQLSADIDRLDSQISALAGRLRPSAG